MSAWYICHRCFSYYYNRWCTPYNDIENDLPECPRCYSNDIERLGDMSKGEPLHRPIKHELDVSKINIRKEYA